MPIYTSIDETVADDADWVQSPASPSGQEYKFRLASASQPSQNTPFTVKIRYKKSAALGSKIDLTVNVYRSDGTTLVATRQITDLSGSIVQSSLALTSGEVASFSSADYTTGIVIGLAAAQTQI
jgi:hypothetical protein